jgi:dihydrofolate reductase
MGIVFTGASMSLDGYVSGPADTGFEHLFDWYNNGDVVVETTHAELTMRMGRASADYFRSSIENTGALVVGRRLFDLTDGWGGLHPLGCPVVVLSHSVPSGWDRDGKWFCFVDAGAEAAVNRVREIAGDKQVGVSAGVVGSQCLDAGLLDEIRIDLVPVVLGAGTPFFQRLEAVPLALHGPISAVSGDRVTHLTYRVRSG